MIYGGGGLSSSTLYTLQSSSSAESVDELNQHQFSGFSKSSKKHIGPFTSSFSGGSSSFSISKSSKKRGKSSKSRSSFGSSSQFSDSSSSSFDDCLVGNTIAEVIQEENGLDILETALELTGLDDTLSSIRRGPFTLFGKLIVY